MPSKKKKLTRGRNSPRLIVPADCGGPETVKQSFTKECDVNNIIAAYTKTGVITHLNQAKPQYGFAPSVDFHAALNIIKKAETAFQELPAKLRKKFDNDPGQFLAYIEDDSNRPEMAELGLLSDEGMAALDAAEKPSDSASAPVPPSPAEEAPTSESAESTVAT